MLILAMVPEVPTHGHLVPKQSHQGRRPVRGEHLNSQHLGRRASEKRAGSRYSPQHHVVLTHTDTPRNVLYWLSGHLLSQSGWQARTLQLWLLTVIVYFKVVTRENSVCLWYGKWNDACRGDGYTNYSDVINVYYIHVWKCYTGLHKWVQSLCQLNI